MEINDDNISETIASNILENKITVAHISLDDVDNLTLIYGPKRDPLFIVLPITLIYTVIFITGVIGNISTCIVIAKNRSMHTATNYYLFSLAISDFLLLLSGVPQEVYSIWSKYPYVFGETFCVLRGIMAETSANATVLTITSFTVERYLAICHPFLQHTMSKLSRAIRLILVVWMVSVFLAIPQALQFGVVTDEYGVDYCALKRIIIKHSFELSTLLFFVTPMTLITVLYILIGLKLRTSGLMKRENGISMQRAVKSCRQQASIGTRRVLKMLVAVVVAFFFCWAPFHAQRLVAFYGNDQVLIYAIMTYISGILYYLSTCINPLLYNIMSNKFREAFKETLGKCCQFQKRNYAKDNSYRVLSRRQRRWNTNQESGDYSGSSVRDESLYSTSTQKQSIDSMALSQCQPAKFTNHNSMKVSVGQDLNGFVHTQRNQLSSIASVPEDKSTDPSKDRIKEFRLSISQKNRYPLQSQSKWSRFLDGLLHWRRDSNHFGYYSPPMERPIDKINIRLTTSEQNDGRHKTNATPKRSMYKEQDDDSISNSSLKDVSADALRDELSSYMEELRLRELR